MYDAVNTIGNLPEVFEVGNLVARPLLSVRLDGDHCPVRPLGHILVQVFGVARRVGLLNIDVAVEQEAEEGVVGHDHGIGGLKSETAPLDSEHPTAVLWRPPPVHGKAAHSVNDGVLLVSFGKVLGALSILHAG